MTTAELARLEQRRKDIVAAIATLSELALTHTWAERPRHMLRAELARLGKDAEK